MNDHIKLDWGSDGIILSRCYPKDKRCQSGTLSRFRGGTLLVVGTTVGTSMGDDSSDDGG